MLTNKERLSRHQLRVTPRGHVAVAPSPPPLSATLLLRPLATHGRGRWIEEELEYRKEPQSFRFSPKYFEPFVALHSVEVKVWHAVFFRAC
jgi:hypothetical protein